MNRSTVLGTGWLWLDPAISLIISGAIVFGIPSLLRDTILHSTPSPMASTSKNLQNAIGQRLNWSN